MTVRVVIADDQAMVRSGLRLLLDVEPDIEVVAEAADGADVVRMVDRHRPDVVLMDVRMPGVDGIEATAEVVRRHEAVRVLILTTFDDDEVVFASLQAGASGFLLKNAPPEELIEAVHVIASGEALLDPAVTRRVIEAVAQGQPSWRTAALDDQLAELTDREREVLVELAGGGSNVEIAEQLYVGEATIKTHVSSVLTKLGLRDRVQAVVFAYESGLVRPGEQGPGGS
ncbi:MAG: response regulator transcription factor [Actinomycetota bacterium]